MKYEITEEQIKELAKGNAKVQRWFPEAFESKPEVGKWYRFYMKGEFFGFFHICEIKNNEVHFDYGIDIKEKKWLTDNWYSITHIWIEATESEVSEAVKKEAVKKYGENWINLKLKAHADDIKGCINGGIYPGEFDFYENKLWSKNGVIFHNGNWAEIIKEKTLSKSEAEKLINELKNDDYTYKIV